MRIIAILGVAVVSGFIAWIGEPLMRNNADLLVAIITLFAVFGGFLVAILSIAGEPLVAKDGSWRRLELNRNATVQRMDRARLLFYAYLIGSKLIIIVLALAKSSDPRILGILKYANYVCLWFTSMGVLFSFALPSMLIGIQQSRIDDEIERRRKPGGDC